MQVSYHEGRKTDLEMNSDLFIYLFIQSSALLMTAGHGHQDIIEFLIDSGAKVNAQDEVYYN